MKKTKRIISYFIAFAMMISMLPQAIVSAEKTAVEYFMASVKEADKNNGYAEAGSLRAFIGNADTAPTLEFVFNLKNDGLYDIWLDSADGNTWKSYTGYRMSYDAELIQNTGEQYGEKTHTSGYQGVTTAWHKADVRELSAGENTLIVGATKKDSYNRYVSVVRDVAVVPRSWGWDPTKSDTPQPMAEAVEYFMASVKEADQNNGYAEVGSLRAIIGNADTAPTLKFAFNLKNDGLYDIWLDSADGNTWKSYTGYKMSYDTELIQNKGEQYGSKTHTSGYQGVTTAWHKADVRELKAGENALIVGATKKDSAGRYVSVVRDVAVVPKSWNWDPTKAETPQKIEIPKTEYGFAYAKDFASKSGDWVNSKVRATTMAIISSNEAEHTLTYEFNLTNSGSYDLWLENVSNDWSSYLAYSIDNGEYVTANGEKLGEATESYDYSIKTQWQKNPSVNLNAGYHTIKFKVNKYSDGRYLAAMNAVALSPTAWEWDPTKSETPQEPAADATEYGFAYATEFASKSGDWVNSKVRATTMAIISSNEAEHTLTYKFNLTNSGSYDLWIENVSNDWSSYLAYSIDNGEYVTARGEKLGEAIVSYDYSIKTQWQKNPSINLTSGVHTIKFKVNKYSDGRYLAAMNAVALSPTAWEWDPTKSEKPQETVAEATEYGFAYATEFAAKTGDWAKSKVRATTMAIISGNEAEHTLTYKFNLLNEGSYDLWIENVTNDWKNYITYSVDNGEFVTAKGDVVGEAVESYDYSVKTQWQKNPSLNLSSGVHTITFKVNKYSDGRYLAAINAIALSPTGWKWEPTMSERPQEIIVEAKEYAWLEAESFDVSEGSKFARGTNSSASGKSYMKVDYKGTEASVSDITYTFEISKKTTFDIDILCTQLNKDHLSKAKFSIDGGEFKYMKDDCVNISDTMYTVSGNATAGTQQPMSWYRISRGQLSAGTHTITIRVDEARVLDNNQWFFAVDAIAVVPKLWNYSPKVTYAEPKMNDYVYIQANNGYSSTNGYSEANRSMQVLTDDTSSAAPNIDFSFRLPKNDTYDIWVDSITGANYDTLLEYAIYSLTPDKYTQSTAERYGKITGTDIGLGKYMTAWHKIATQDIAAGGWQLSLRAVADPETNRYLSAVSRVVIVPSSWNWSPAQDGDPYDTAHLPLTITPGGENIELTGGSDAQISFSSKLSEESDADVLYEIQLEWNGEKVASVIQRPDPLLKNRKAGTDYTDKIIINVPKYAPYGNYDIKLRTSASAEWITLSTATIGDADEVVKKTAQASDILVSGNKADVTFSANLAQPTNARLEFYKDDVLWAVKNLGSIEVETSAQKYSFTLDKLELPSGTYTVKAGLSEFETTSTTASYTATGSADIKPLANGNFYSKKTGSTHFWYVNQEGAMIWDGEAFIPMGGMFCPQFINSFNSDDVSSNNNRWKGNVNEVLEYIEMHDIKDLYINAVMNEENIVAWQYLIDYLEDRGIRYGIQPDLGIDKKYDGYYIGANVNSISTTTIISSNASVEVDLKQVGNPDELKAKYYVISNGKVSSTGDAVCTIDTENETATFEAKNVGTFKTVYFLPYVKGAKTSAPNIFAEEKAKAFEKINSLMSKLNVGDGFRLVVDPVGNEVAYSNTSESFIPYNEEYSEGFALWLEEKYGTVSMLNDEWQISPSVTSFAEAAQMMPIYTNNGTTILAKADTNEIYSYNSASGCMWDDCVLYRESSFANYLNEAADAVKAVNDVPVVYKNVAYVNPFFANTNTSGGHDGIGAEAYGDVERVAEKSAIANTLGRQSAKTMWNIVTEVNVEEDMVKKAQSGVISYGDKKTMYEYFNALYAAGAKGVYDFVFNSTNDLLDWYAYAENPEMYSWLGEYIKSINSEAVANDCANEQVYAVYPSANATWNWNGTSEAHNKRSAVLPENDSDKYKYRVLSNGAYAIGTYSLDVSADTIIINIKNAPLSKIYGKEVDEKLDELLSQGKTVMVMGLRQDLGQIPAIDQYYTSSTATVNGAKVQILNPPAGAQTLATTTSGKVYAFKYGNLYVIADNNWTERETYFTSNDLATAKVALNKALYTRNGNIHAMPQKGDNAVTFKFNNYTTNAVDGSAIIAINGCEEIIQIPVSVTAGANNIEITKNISVNTENINSVTYYLWDSLGGMTPLTPKQ